MPTRISLLRGIGEYDKIGLDPVSLTAIITGATQVISSIINKANNKPGGGQMPDALKRSWIEAMVREYAGRFSDQTDMWPVLGRLIPEDWIAQQVIAHNYHGGYEELKEIVSKRGTADGKKYKAANGPVIPGSDPNDPLQGSIETTPWLIIGAFGVLGLGYFLLKK